MSGQWSGTGTQIVPCPLLDNGYGHLQTYQWGKIHFGSQGYAHGPIHLLWRGEPDSSAHKRVNPAGASGLLIGTRAKSLGFPASSGSKAVGLLGGGTPTDSSTVGTSTEALSAGARVMGSFFTTSNMLRSSRSPLSSRAVRQLWSSCTALQSSSGGIPEWTAHLWRAMANTIISSHHTTL